MSKFDKWYTSHYDVETRMTDPGHRADLLEAWMAGKRSVADDLRTNEVAVSVLQQENERLHGIISRYAPSLLHESPPVYCEHGAFDGDWCEDCNRELKAARAENAEGVE